MKLRVISFIVCLSLLSLTVLGAERIFTDVQGRTIEGELVNFDEAGSMVSIVRKGSRNAARVPISIFVEDDQEYIREWATLQAITDRRLKADIKRISDKDEGNTYGTSASTSVMTDHYFKIVFENGTKTSLEDVNLEYVIYYEQDHHQGRSNAERKQGTLYANEKLTLPARETTEYETQKVKLWTWNTYSLAPIDAKIHGIRVRLTLTSAKGMKEMREYVYPSSLDLAWTTESNDARRRVAN